MPRLLRLGGRNEWQQQVRERAGLRQQARQLQQSLWWCGALLVVLCSVALVIFSIVTLARTQAQNGLQTRSGQPQRTTSGLRASTGGRTRLTRTRRADAPR